jgi:hypothetical protein
MEGTMIQATVSGSFHRHMPEVAEAVRQLRELDVSVLSPAEPWVVDQVGDFLFVASDRVRSIRLVEDRHLDCIRHSDFLWLVTPDGYVGPSAAMEIGFACACGVPVLAQRSPTDVTLQRYIQVCDGPAAAVQAATSPSHPRYRFATFLTEPETSIEGAHRDLERIRKIVSAEPCAVNDSAAREIYSLLRGLPRVPISSPS